MSSDALLPGLPALRAIAQRDGHIVEAHHELGRGLVLTTEGGTEHIRRTSFARRRWAASRFRSEAPARSLGESPPRNPQRPPALPRIREGPASSASAEAKHSAWTGQPAHTWRADT